MSTELPADMWKEIFSHLTLKEQLGARKVAKSASNIPFDTTQCCTEPTSAEIIRWLSYQQSLLTEKLFPYSAFKPIPATWLGKGYRIALRDSKSNKYGRNKEIIIMPQDYKISGRTDRGYNSDFISLNTHQDLVNFIDGMKLDLRDWRPLDDDYNTKRHVNVNWSILRDILRLRTSCTRHGWDSEKCYKTFILEHKTDIRYLDLEKLNKGKYSVLKDLFYLLKPETKRRLLRDLQIAAGVHNPKYKPANMLIEDPNMLERLSNFLQSWILKNVSSSDLEWHFYDYAPNNQAIPVYDFESSLNPFQRFGYWLKDIAEGE